MDYAKYIDHTNLKAFATKDDIFKLCSEANTYKFMSVCVNPANVSLAKTLLQGSGVLVCTVVGFPLGANTTEIKKYEATLAITDGASEIDMVINVAKAKEHDYDYIENEIKELVNACNGVLLKVIIETCYLTDEEIVEVSKRCVNAGADFVKTSTGFGSRGASVEDVKLIKETVKDKAYIKASGGIKTKEDFLKMIEAGASRIGTSNGVQIMEELNG